ncbi:MAG TPA: hypothetical protein VFA83_13340 [Acidimicrobiales bacterium]|nr:hypothetical protein [Acidimicrobiales bacterium]
MARRFPESITLTGDEALGILVALEEAITYLEETDRLGLAVSLTEGRLLLLDKLTEGWGDA